MNLLQTIAYYKQVWSVVIPNIPEPDEKDAARWCKFKPEVVENAMLRTAQRFAPDRIGNGEGFTPEMAYKFVTAIASGTTASRSRPSPTPAHTAVRANPMI
jgi:hypothetical protein